MTIATLQDVLAPALAGHFAVAGMVVLGWEDAVAFVEAAEAEGVPVILQAGPACRAHTPLPVLGSMFRFLAERSTVPVVAHLDHGFSADECQHAIDVGFSSVMYDGSRLPLAENIRRTAEIVRAAHAANVSVEGEIGFVGYAGGEPSKGTNASEAQRFAVETNVDAMAISIGNVHLQTDKAGRIDFERLRSIEAVTNIPLVVHGGSGIAVETRLELATCSNVCKFNIGTEIRMVFGSALREVLLTDPDCFDRVVIMKNTMPAILQATRKVLRSMGQTASADSA